MALAPPSRLLVVEGETSTSVLLPDHSDLDIGTAADAAVRLRAPGLAAVEATLRVRGEQLTLDSSRARTRIEVNGQSAPETCVLYSGDILTVGDASIAVHIRAQRAAALQLLDMPALRARLLEDIERCHRNRSTLAVVCVRLGDPESIGDGRPLAQAVRGAVRLVDVVGWDGRAEVLVLLPDTGERAMVPALRILGLMAATPCDARVGVALCPGDADDVEALIAGARIAADAADPRGVAAVGAGVLRRSVGDRMVVAVDPRMRQLLGLVERLARADLPVLVTGETGVGKEIVALALHAWSARRGRPLVSLNCAAVAESLFESELFGHEKGAFTDASSAKPGLFEAAEGGTVFLDEIGECPPRVQAKLLRVVETRRVARLGSVVEKRVDVRIVAATNRDLEADVAAGRFRQDLLFRLRAAGVIVPPLRERPLDVPVLAAAFLAEACRRLRREPATLSAEARRRLGMHDWPGNVRELENLMGLCAAMVDGPIVDAGDLPPEVARATAPWLAGPPARRSGEHAPSSVRARPDAEGQPRSGCFESFDQRTHRSLRDEVRALEQARIREALVAASGVRVQAAALLDMPLRTLVTKIALFRLDTVGRHSSPSGEG